MIEAISGGRRAGRRNRRPTGGAEPAMPRLAFAALLVLASAALSACTEAFGSRLDERTFRIEGPEVPGGSDAPNRRLAEKLCPKGYRVLEEGRRKSDPTSQIGTTWTIRCL